MINCTILPNGNLELNIPDEFDREDIEYIMTEHGFWTAFCDGMESYSCNGSFTPFDAGDANPFVGLTSAPCIAESMDIADNGDCEIVGRFWFFDNYMIDCPIDRLCRGESVVFTLAGE